MSIITVGLEHIDQPTTLSIDSFGNIKLNFRFSRAFIYTKKKLYDQRIGRLNGFTLLVCIEIDRYVHVHVSKTKLISYIATIMQLMKPRISGHSYAPSIFVITTKMLRSNYRGCVAISTFLWHHTKQVYLSM